VTMLIEAGADVNSQDSKVKQHCDLQCSNEGISEVLECIFIRFVGPIVCTN
jgi:hypothetical protein